MILRAKRGKHPEQQQAEKQTEDTRAARMPPKKRKEKQNSERVDEIAHPPTAEKMVNTLIEHFFPLREDLNWKKKSPNVEQKHPDKEEYSRSSKRKLPEDRITGNREIGKRKRTRKGKKPQKLNKFQERDEALDQCSQHGLREEDGLPITIDEGPQIATPNSQGSEIMTPNSQGSEIMTPNSGGPEIVTLDVGGARECHLEASAMQNFSGSSLGASSLGMCGGEDLGSSTQKKLIYFNDKGQPIGEGSTTFCNDLGKMARKHCPILYEQWRDVPDKIKGIMWKLVTDKYVVPVAYRAKILHKMNEAWRSFKCILRSKHYYVYDTDEERKRNCPTGVKQDVWEIFVDNQSKPVAQARQRAGKLARQLMKTPHTTGRTGAARTAEVLRKENPCGTVTRTDLYLALHTRKDGSCLTPELATKVEKIKAITQKDPSSVNLDVDHDPVSQVCGPDTRGLVRGMGGGISKTALLHSGPVIDQLEQERRLRVSVEEQIAELREQVVSQRSATAVDQLEERRACHLAEGQIVDLRQQVVSQKEQIDQLQQEKAVITELREQINQLQQETATIADLREQVAFQGKWIADLKALLIGRLCS